MNDYELVVRGLAGMLAVFKDRVRVAEWDAGLPPGQPVDVTLYDTFASPQVTVIGIDALLTNPACGRVVVYSWNTCPGLVQAALDEGASSYLPKSLTGVDLVCALERVHAGELVTPQILGDSQITWKNGATEPDKTLGNGPAWWPGQEFGLSARESEVLALITQGLSNTDIAVCTHLSANTVKTYIRSAYRKIEVDTRSRAVIWGMNHMMTPDRIRVAAQP